MSNIKDKKHPIKSNEKSQKSKAGTRTLKSPGKEYTSRILTFEFFYSQVLIGVSVVIVAAIVVALLLSVLIGAIIAVAAVIFYRYAIDLKLKKLLGLGYKLCAGGLSISSYSTVWEDAVWIPSRLMWQDIISIEADAFIRSKKHALNRVFLPRTLTSISPDAFGGCKTLKEINFEGTKEEWQAIEGTDALEGYSLNFNVKYPPIHEKEKNKAKAK